MSDTITLLAMRDGPETTPRFTWETKLLANAAAGANTRLRVCPRLTAARWPGNIDVASRIADKLVDNAVRHGRPFPDGCVTLRLTVVPDTERLLIEVDDAAPDFPDFDAALAEASGGCGLWWVKHYRARLTWEEKKDGDGRVVGKTVKALVFLSWAEATA
ncbi:ATP-binding protein [Streptomyces sp. NPDC101213]|uniref:ATP-binding protein n=1 Tax=Streptomyces sp. NPDC101213 TaxID=3366130 RepID=UPI00381E81BA